MSPRYSFASLRFDGRCTRMGLQETLFPPRKKQIAQRCCVIVAVNVGAFHRIEVSGFLGRQRHGKLAYHNRRVGKFGTVAGIPPQRTIRS